MTRVANSSRRPRRPRSGRTQLLRSSRRLTATSARSASCLGSWPAQRRAATSCRSPGGASAARFRNRPSPAGRSRVGPPRGGRPRPGDVQTADCKTCEQAPRSRAGVPASTAFPGRAVPFHYFLSGYSWSSIASIISVPIGGFSKRMKLMVRIKYSLSMPFGLAASGFSSSPRSSIVFMIAVIEGTVSDDG
jgi:hypothetical protein